MRPTLTEALKQVEEEVKEYQHRPNPTFHHGYAVILEELDELWEEVRKRSCDQDKDRMRREACQVAASAIRFMTDLT